MSSFTKGISGVLVLVLVIAGHAARTSAQPAAPAAAGVGDAFSEWLRAQLIAANQATGEAAKVAVGSRSNANQTEAPSISTNSTTLVDTSSASDLVGIALNAAGLTAGTSSSKNSTDTTTGSATVSGYALYAAALGYEPLSPEYYCQPWASAMRRFSFTAGFDDGNSGTNGSAPSATQSSGSKPAETTNSNNVKPIIAGAKVILWGRDVCRADFAKVQEAVDTATTAFGKLSNDIQNRLLEMYQDGKFNRIFNETRDGSAVSATDEMNFLNKLRDTETFTKIQTEVGLDTMNSWVTAAAVKAFSDLNSAASLAIAEFQQRPQFSVSFQTKQPQNGGADQYQGEAIFDYGINRLFSFTGNGSYNVQHIQGQNAQGGQIAAGLQFQFSPDKLTGPKPVRLSLLGQAKWMEGVSPTYSAQFKINLPIPYVQWLAGVEVPISITVANRSDLINEAEVRGTIGFTIDTSQVLATMRNISGLDQSQ
jgi:hypothetical protein